MLKRLVRSERFRAFVGTALAGWFRLVRRSCRTVVEPPGILQSLDEPRPVIVTTWHGEHFMLPFVTPNDRWRVKAMISRSRDGELNVIVLEKLGFGAIRASAGKTGEEVRRRGGVAGFVAALRELRLGTAIVLTADLPKGPAKVAGEGIVQIARHAGVPILPVATATSYRKRMARSWDSAAFNLPFGRFAIVFGEPIEVPTDADAETIEAKRRAVETELNRVTARAYEIAGGRDV
ncbi:MAG: lysophospholipid acyltransferase family protein [Siculibacillus sp.]|nr:lysophospholipid acyltransferase family protein [Siculibacillus sp.]